MKYFLLAGMVFLSVFAVGQGGRVFGSLSRAEAREKAADQNLQWFREEMKIAPKYQEEEGGIWGMSLGHFLTMVFMFAFLLGTLIALYLRNKRTREILSTLLKEEADGNHR